MLDKIINKLLPYFGDNVIEIGPGKGSFTFPLAKHVNKVVTIEKDYHLSNYLKECILKENYRNIKVFTEDIMKYRIPESISKSYSVFGSLPYNKTQDIIEKFLFLTKPRPKNLMFIIQKEMAVKYKAVSPNNNYLSILTQLTSRITPLLDIDPGCFTPPPSVKSSLVVFDLINIDINTVKIAKFAKTLFKQPRKTVKNNLHLKIKTNSKNKTLLDKRAAELTPKEFRTLYLLYNKN